MSDKIYRVKCKSYDTQGRGIVHFNGSNIPVEGLIVGEMAHIRLKHTKEETVGVLCDVEIPSPHRIEIACPYAEKCGACQLMHMDYPAQLDMKKMIVGQLLDGICPVTDVMGMADFEAAKHYRTKIHATFSKDRKGNIIAGTYEEKSHRVIDIDACLMQDEKANKIIAEIKRLMKVQKIEPYNEDRQKGILRHALIRTGRRTNQVMVVLVTGSSYFPGKKTFVKALTCKCPEITTVIINENGQKTSMILGEKEEIVLGQGYIEDELCGVRFCISPKSFFQVNPAQTEVLYTKAIQMAGISKDDVVLDAYCGIGTISLICASKAKQVIGVEINRQAVKNAKTNAAMNHITNAKFYCEDAGRWMERCASSDKLTPNVVFMDPPRGGASQQFLKALVRMAPKKIVYISCNPVTLKRDLLWLKGKGYKAEMAQPIDMFIGSSHVETVCLLGNRNAKPDTRVKLSVDTEELQRVKNGEKI